MKNGQLNLFPEDNSLGNGAPTRSLVFVDYPVVHVARGQQARRTGARHGHQWCHMWSDDLTALHLMAKKIGMRREWFQDRPGFPHYDLVPTRRALAIQNGAIERSLRDYLLERKGRTNPQGGTEL